MKNCHKVIIHDSDTIIISFSGRANMKYTEIRFEFMNFLEKEFNHISRQFYMDTYSNSYHNGIEGFSTSIDETVDYLKGEIAGYKTVIFMGVSQGGYAAILLGSLLSVTAVIAFIPQTYRTQKTDIDKKYKDSKPFINKETQYYLYGDLSISNIHSFHHISHCERIVEDNRNITIIRKNPLDIIKITWFDKELANLIKKIINS
jgi:hypothetical protein